MISPKLPKISKNTLMLFISLMGTISVLYFYLFYLGYAPFVYDKLEWWFIVWILTGMEVLAKDKGIGLAIFCFAFQLLVWGVTYLLIKITFIDTFWPRFRIITPMKDLFWVCRKIMWTKGTDTRYKYCYVKFHLFPLLSWNIIKVPKPEKFHKKAVDGGFEGVRWRRFPASIDIFCPTTNVIFDKKENVYVMGVEQDLYRHDDVGEYEKQAFEGIQKIGTQVIESVKGDWSLIKEQFHMGIVVREKELPKIIAFKDEPEVTETIPVVSKIQPKINTDGIQPKIKKGGVPIKIIRHRAGDDEPTGAEPNEY